MKSQPTLFITIGALLCTAAMVAAQITIPTVAIGNPGNANDTVMADDYSGLYFGGVGYNYKIGTYDVTLTQYTAFLNAVGQTDPYGLYNSSLATDLNVAGILRIGSSGNYSYSVIGSGQRPVTYVSWLDAARFTNWLSNGQPVGLQTTATTEAGAYTLNGDTNQGLELKNPNAQYWIPTENEWYKAAYYDPSLNGGAGGYVRFPTRSNSVPGNVVGSLSNQANYNNGVYSVTRSNSYSYTQNYLTDVGAFIDSASAYGTFDQGGDVFQWNGAVIGSSRGLRGGSWYDSASNLLSSTRYPNFSPTIEQKYIGFRVATVPEPDGVVSFILAGGLLLARRRRAA